MPTLGPTFGTELLAACGPLPIAWSADGVFSGLDALPLETQAAVQAVVDAHDPTQLPPPPPIDGATFLGRVTDEEYAAIVGSTNIQVKRWLDIFRLRGEIEVTGNTAQAAKAGLVALGLLTQERADAIFV